MTTQRIQDTDVFAADIPAITIAEPDQTWTIIAGVLVSSARNNAVFGRLDSQTLFNFGNILSGSPDAAAVNLSGDHSAVTNGVGARIIGVDIGVLADGNTASVVNQGSIDGITGVGAVFGASSSNVALTNSGTIHGRFEGVAVFSANGGTIHNAGLIVSEDRAIEVFTGAGQTTVIVNAATGAIAGAGDAIRVDGGNIVLANFGTLTGDVEASVLEKDVIVNNGKITGNVFLGGGNDVYSGIGRASGVISGSGGNDRLTGGAGADFLNGGPDNDLLRGAAGNDKLAGDFGLDTLTGGAGRDRFLFQSALDPVFNVDRITDFAVGVDKIVLGDGLFTRLGADGLLAAARFHVGAAAADASDRIIYNPNNGFLFYDADGKGGAAAIHFATLTPHLALHSTDFLVAALLIST
jgi:Ca2+-binding RTX toxin-like protein